MFTVKLHANLRDLAGARAIEVPFQPGGTVRELIEAIRAEHPALADKLVTPDGELSGLAHIFLHGRNILWLDSLDTVIDSGKEIDLIPPAAGG